MTSPLARSGAPGLVLAFVVVSVSASASGENALDRVSDLWRGASLAEREKVAATLSGDAGTDDTDAAGFDGLYARLKSGPRYGKDVKTGLVQESRKGERFREQYVFLVPDDYDPAKRYRVAFYLHGGVNRPEPWKKGDSWWRRFDRMDGTEQISVFPSSWRGSLWWQPSAIENLAAILDRIKADYNVDENRVYLFGVSDGGTGVYYHAFKAPTIWAAFLPFIGHPGVLDNPATGADGEMFVTNLVNKPFFVVNGESDPLYPAARVKVILDEYEKAGVEIVFHSVPGGHNTRFWNGEREAIESFLDAHPRNPLPDRLVWETDRSDRSSRIDWLVIESLQSYGKPGSIELERSGNRVEVRARGVASYRLLLSPEQFDLGAPLEVVTNGTRSFRGVVRKSTETLLHWAARDLDRTMLFAAEIRIDLTEESGKEPVR